jgi:hypothetical protein
MTMNQLRGSENKLLNLYKSVSWWLVLLVEVIGLIPTVDQMTDKTGENMRIYFTNYICMLYYIVKGAIMVVIVW